MAFTKITPEDRAGKGNAGLPDTPNFTTSQMQEQMDSLPNLAIDKFNDFIDEISAVTGAINVGAEVPTGISAQANVQSILNAMVLSISLNTASRHSHGNKTTLDAITQTEIDAYNRIATMLTSILSVDQLVTNNNSGIPTTAAVKNFVDDYDISSKILSTAYPVGIVVSAKGMNPQSVFGGTWTSIDTDANGVTRYQRTA